MIFINLLFSFVSKHVVFKVALGIKALTTVFWAYKRLFAPMDTHVHLIVLANAEYFSTLKIGAAEGLRARVQVHMLVETGLPREHLLAPFVLAFEFLIDFTFLRSFPSPLGLELRLDLGYFFCG